MKITTVTCLIGLLLTSPVCADVNSDMNNFFGKLGFDGNTSRPQVWQGQAAGYASGGSMYMRTSVRQIQMVSLSLPSMSAGCGGIDAYLGSFSHINGEELQRFVKQIMGNAAGYFFDLALQTTVPEMKQAKDFLQKLASDVNSANMSSCQAAQGIVGGLFPRTAVSQKKVCQDIAGESNLFSDWAASQQGCTVGGSYDSVTNKASDKTKDQVMKNKNVMWDAIKEKGMFSNNQELAEFAMSLTGSLIYDANSQVKILSPITTNEDVLKAMMNGGSATIYKCDSTDLCLNPRLTSITISAGNSMNGQVISLLKSIQNKAVSDEPLSVAEKGFLEATSVPVLRYLVDPLSVNIGPAVVYQLADYIGYDIMMQYMNEMITAVRTQIGGKNYPGEVVDQLDKSLTQATTLIAGLQTRVQIKQDAVMAVERQMSYLRQQVSSRLIQRYQGNYRFTGE
ncbi:conjugal transfer pilus assembly protein TraH [Rahnella bonaserana]|uniref:conjugal transfer pilus assembly protein TraH n=1 Tax=Rahnella bonaserana TaxID=2816248 RepID=UPI00320AA3DA